MIIDKMDQLSVLIVVIFFQCRCTSIKYSYVIRFDDKILNIILRSNIINNLSTPYIKKRINDKIKSDTFKYGSLYLWRY